MDVRATEENVVVQYIALEDFLEPEKQDVFEEVESSRPGSNLILLQDQQKQNQNDSTSKANILSQKSEDSNKNHRSLQALADAATALATSVESSQQFKEKEKCKYEEGLRAATRRRKERNPIPEEKKDQKYWERRYKNNVAARRSRETKKERENMLTDKAIFLENEYNHLRSEIESAKLLNSELKRKLEEYEKPGQDFEISSSAHKEMKEI